MAARAKKVVLTEKLLRSLSKQKHPGEPSRIFYYDAVLPGLNVMWTSTGHLSFGMTRRWSDHGAPTWRKLGDVYLPAQDKETKDAERDEEERAEGALKLAEARSKGRRWLDMLARGIDPATEAKRQRQENVQRITFAALRDEHIKRHWRGKLRKADEAERLLKREFADWDERAAAEITDDDVDAVITAIVDRGTVGQARNVFAYLQGLYTWAKANRRYRIKTSPCDGFSPKKMFGEKPTRDRWLKDDELRAIWAAAPVLGLAAPVLELLLITACRLNEIAGLRREEIGEDEIIIPAARMKNKLDFMIPITPRIREIIRNVPKYTGGPCVFSTTDGLKPMTVGSKLKNRLDEAVREGRHAAWLPDLEPWTWHDLRRSARTNFSKLSITEDVREVLLAHVKKGLINTYDCHDFMPEKRAALTKWEAALARILAPPSSVTVLDAARERRAQL
jgi:integrase